MEYLLFRDADYIVKSSIAAVLPEAAVRRALAGRSFRGRVRALSIGKAAWRMAKAASECVTIEKGLIITKYGHCMGELPGFECIEAGHPVPDENSIAAVSAALSLASGLGEKDVLLFLVSGGGSALFEKPLVPLKELVSVTEQLLACGADIEEMNTIRKRLSAVKGGRFALSCAPARVVTIALSDVLGSRPDLIASGPACADPSASEDALKLVDKYGLSLSPETRRLLLTETPKSLPNAEVFVTGSVRELCSAAAAACEELGYRPVILTAELACEAREAGRMLASVLREHEKDGARLAFIAGGETVVKLTGRGRGGRNQELALAAAEGIRGMANAAVFSFGSDGTDGPTDAAGGFADGSTALRLEELGLAICDVLRENDSYHALEKTGGLIFTGPTGTNVNDAAVGLLG